MHTGEITAGSHFHIWRRAIKFGTCT
jgi:hypothetical protein